MCTWKRPIGRCTDTVKSIRRIGSLEDKENATLIIDFKLYGRRDFRYQDIPDQFEDLWNNAHKGSKIELVVCRSKILKLQRSSLKNAG